MPFSSGDERELPYVERRLIELQRAFDAGVRLAAVETMLLCQQWNLPWPAWVQGEALDIILTMLAGDDRSKGRTGNWIAECCANYIHWVRYETAHEIRMAQIVELEGYDLGRTKDRCWAEASRFLRGTIAQGSSGAVRDSYNLVADNPSLRFVELPLTVRHFGFDESVEEASRKAIDETIRRLRSRRE